MQTVNVKAYWYMVQTWVVKKFDSLNFVYSYKIMLKHEAV